MAANDYLADGSPNPEVWEYLYIVYVNDDGSFNYYAPPPPAPEQILVQVPGVNAFTVWRRKPVAVEPTLPPETTTATTTTNDFMSGEGGDFGGASGEWDFLDQDWNNPTADWTDQSTDYMELPDVVIAGADTPNYPTAGSGRGSGGPTTVEDFIKHKSAAEQYTLKFEPNMLDNYDQYTYHWKLFIVSTDNANTGDVLNLDNQSIIAESAVTDMTIDKVEIKAICVPSVSGGTGTQTEVKFEIVEPAGAGLIDKLYYQALALGIGNWYVMPCYLQLEFRARDPETSESIVASSGGDTAVGSLQWVWPLKLTDLKAHVTHVGTRYEFSAIPYDESTQTNANFTIQSNIVLSGIDTVASAMSALQDKLNADQYEKLIVNYTIPDSYRIIVDPELGNLSMLTTKDGQSTAWGRDFSSFDKKTASYNAGTGIDKIIDSILGTVDSLQMAIQGSATPDGTPLPAKKLPDQMKKLWRIITECKPIAFDHARNDNAVEMTIYIVKYDVGVLDVSAAQVGQTAATKDVAKQRVAEYAGKRILKKRYDYIFTGLNDQILNFDLSLNFAFAAALTRFGGLYYDGFTQTPGVTAKNKTAEKNKSAIEAIRKAVKFLNTAPPNTDTTSVITAAWNEVNESDLDEASKTRLRTLLENAKPLDRPAYLAKLKAESVAEAKKHAGLLAQDTPVTNAYGQKIGNPTFISDVDISSTMARTAGQNLVSDMIKKSTKLRPVAFREDKQEAALAVGVDPKNDAARNRVSNVFSSALYSAVDGNLQQIKMTVKGDPYWLFPRPINSSDKKLTYKSTMSDQLALEAIKAQTTQTVNTNTTDNFIILRFRTPKMFNDISGVIDTTVEDTFSEVETFSGVYRVISVDSKFDMGKFHQEMTCIVDPMIDLVDITTFISDMEEASGKVKNTPADKTPINSIPKTAIKHPTVYNTETFNEFGFSSEDPFALLDLGGIPVDPNPTVEGE